MPAIKLDRAISVVLDRIIRQEGREVKRVARLVGVGMMSMRRYLGRTTDWRPVPINVLDAICRELRVPLVDVIQEAQKLSR